MENLVRNRRYSNLILLLLIRALYTYSTVIILKKLWYYGGGYDINFSWQKEIFAITTFVIITLYFLNTFKSNTFKSIVVQILFTLYYIPLNASFSIHNQSWFYYILTNIYFFFLLFFCSTSIYIGQFKLTSGLSRANNDGIERKDKLLFVVRDKKILKVILSIICLMCIMYKFYYNGLSFYYNIFGDDLYVNREIYVESMYALDRTFLGYLATLIINLAGYAVPFYLYLSLMEKSIVGSILSIVCLISIFSINSSKSVILFILIVFITFFYEKKKKSVNFLKNFDLSVFCALLTSLIVYLIFKKYKFYFFIMRREMFLPSWLATKYYTLFENISKIYWSQSTFILQRIIPDTYSESALSMVNKAFFNGYIPSPNTGLFADAFINFGSLGVIVYPLILSFVLSWSDTVYAKYGKGLMILMAIKLSIHLTNVQLLRTDFVLSFFLFTFILWGVSQMKHQ